jgi:predicted MFS family arabinose efflux permease
MNVFQGGSLREAIANSRLPICTLTRTLFVQLAIENRKSAMTTRQLKTGYFVLAALNTFANCCFFNYLFFFLHDRFGFDNRQNLWVSALYGFIYVFSAWQCGKFAQRHGFLKSLKLGFGGLAVLMVIGGLMPSAFGVLCVLVGYAIVLLFTWPALEALVSENETRQGVQHRVGVYNCVWSAAAALAYFTEGRLYDWQDRGAVFWLPAGLFTCQFVLVHWLARHASRPAAAPSPPAAEPAPPPEPAALRQSGRPQAFLKMAWLANPFAYVAMNTLLAVMPGIAEKLALSPTQVGLYCSIWFFGRFAAFAVLWRWTGWHYRFRWLLAAFLTLIISFVVLMTIRDLRVFVLAQVFFGVAAGLIYYSSLFYSMDAGETKGEHGGLHEAAIGAGVFAGPAVGAASLQFLPHHSNTGVLAVSALLVLGLFGLLFLWKTGRQP